MMKPIISLALSVLLVSLFSCSQKPITLSGDFERGCLGKTTEVSPGHFRIESKHWLKRDSIGDQYYWFCFRADQVKDKKLTVDLTNLIGVYRGNPHIVYTDYTQPVYSYDQQHWERIKDVAYDSAGHEFTFSQLFTREPVWIAFAQPYTYSRLQQLVNSVRDKADVSVNSLAQTAEGRNIDMFNITNDAISDQDKKNVVILAAQHAGEDAGAFLAEGLINFLVSDAPGAAALREKFIYHIVPLMNPDGFYHGITRYNTKMEDLNNIWTSDSLHQPEVTGVKNWVDGLTDRGRNVDLFIDLHNHTQFYDYNVYIFEDHSLDTLASLTDHYWPVRSWHSEFAGSSCAWMFRKGIPAATIELSQGHLDHNENYITIDDYHDWGKGLAQAINDYFNIAGE